MVKHTFRELLTALVRSNHVKSTNQSAVAMSTNDVVDAVWRLRDKEQATLDVYAYAKVN